MTPSFDNSCMDLAIAQATLALGRTYPNPCVGSVVAIDDRVVATGFHQKAGTAHAEINAMQAARAAGASLERATVYVTLEPCSHTGRTGPCALALIDAKVRRVVYGCIDPNPRVSGQGIALLRQAGIVVDGPVRGLECQRLIRDFAVSMNEQRPYVIAKSAISVDGNIATARGESKWITSEEARADGRRLRGTVQAIMAGRGTVMADDPLLTARMASVPEPLRIVFDSTLKVSPKAHVLGENSLVVTTKAASKAAETRLLKRGGRVWRMPGRPDVKKTLQRLYREHGMTRVLLEGGATMLGAFAKSGVIDEWWVYIAPTMLGDGTRAVSWPVPRLAGAPRFVFEGVERIGPDVRLILVKA